MTFVLDATVTMSWCFEDETSPYAESVLEYLQRNSAVVPAIWPLEVANTLLAGERRGRVTRETTEALLAGMRDLPIVVETSIPLSSWNRALVLGRSQRLSLYDATYLALALREDLPLATQDERLRIAAARVEVPLFSTEAE